MGEVDIEITCKVCGKWKKSGKINANPENLFSEVLKFVAEQASKHNIHGLGGYWEVKYGPH